MNEELKLWLVRQKKILDDLLAEQTKLLDKEKKLGSNPESITNLCWIYIMTGEAREAIQQILD